MAPRSARPTAARYAAPTAFLAAVTVAVLLIRAGLGGGGAPTTTRGPATLPTTTAGLATTAAAATTTTTAAGFYTVQSGDTFGSIAAKEGTSVAQLERLNPGVSSNSLQVGQKIRVK